MDNKKIIILELSLILFLVTIYLFLYLPKKNEYAMDEKYSSESYVDINKASDVGTVNIKQSNEDDALNLLPEELSLFMVQKNGFNEDKTFYSVNVYVSHDAESRLKTAGLSVEDWGQYAGCWIVNLQNNTSYKIASAVGRQDSNFNQWVKNDEIELVGDGKHTATTYNATTGDVVVKRIFNLNTDVDVSNWNIYRSEEHGFELKYPKNLIIEEISNSYVENLENRYILFSNPENGADIFLGVKNSAEENVSPRPFRTGIGASESLSRGVVAFGDGFANEKWLVSFGEGNTFHVEEIWFCKDGSAADLSCDNIKVNDEMEAYMGVDVGSKIDVTKLQEVLGGMIKTFHTL